MAKKRRYQIKGQPNLAVTQYPITLELAVLAPSRNAWDSFLTDLTDRLAVEALKYTRQKEHNVQVQAITLTHGADTYKFPR